MRLFRFFLFLVPILLYGTDCSKDTDSGLYTPPGTTTGTLKLYLTDAPGEFSEVNITFSEISVKFGDTWITVSETEQTFNLLSLTGGLTALMGEEALVSGEYGQIRLLISSAEVVIVEEPDEITYPLQIPSGSASGLKIGKGFTIEEEGEVLELVIDFDAARSINKLGSNDLYQLKPVLRLVAAEQSGAITGEVVSEPRSGLTAYAIAGIDTVASTAVDETNGEFKLAFLPADTYTVTIVDSDDYELYSQSDVVVNTGFTTKLGDITLF